MTVARQKFFARLGLLGFAAICGIWLARLDYSQKISTNVLDLIPASEQAPEINLVRGFANDVQSRVMLFALRDPASSANGAEAGARFAAALSAAPEFAEAVVVGDPSARDKLGRQIFERRFELLLPGWLGAREEEFKTIGQPAEEFSAWLAEKTAKDLESFLSEPEATAMQEILQADPLLLVPRLVGQAQLLGARGGGAAHDYALVWARIKASPLAEAGQQPVFAAIERALSSLRETWPGVELRWSGINRFAAASRVRIEAEIRLLNFFSVAAVLGVATIFVRRIYKIIHLVPVILLSIAGAWTISTMVFDRLHILVFVIGSLLSGVAIDYGIYIYMQPSLRPDEPYATKLRRLLKPLLASCLTTVIGFSLLLFSDLPLIRQIGLFVGAGLLCALGAAMTYFAQLERPLLEGRQFGGLGAAAQSPVLRWVPRILLAAAVLVAVVGPLRLQWKDDVHELDIPARELNANEEALRALFGESTGRTMYLSQGNTPAEARQHLQEFLTYRAKSAPGVPTSSLGMLLPTETDWRAQPARWGKLEKFPVELRAALERHGFSGESFAPFFEAWQRARSSSTSSNGDYAQLATSVNALLTGPLSMLASAQAPFWFLTVVEESEARPAPAELHTVSVSQLQSLNALFTRYRWSALKLSLIGLALVIASVFAIYPFRRGLRIALIPAGSCFFVFGVFGLIGQPLNLFHLLGAFLGVCLSHNYAIFSSENAGVGGAPPVSIRLSALATATSFGVLAFSHIPVIHALGLTVALIVVTTLAVVELEPMAAGRSA